MLLTYLITIKLIMRNIMTKDLHPSIYQATHSDLPFPIFMVGIAHANTMDDLSVLQRLAIDTSNVLFHEGFDGTVFGNVFNYPYTWKKHYKARNIGKLSEQDKQHITKIFDIYFKHVHGQDNVQINIDDLNFWAIDYLLEHYDYYRTGQEVDYTIHRMFQARGYNVFNLDSLHKLITEFNNTMFHAFNANSIRDTLNTKILQLDDDASDEEDEVPLDLQNLCDVISLNVDFMRTEPTYTTGRNIEWFEKISHFLHYSREDNTLKPLILCGTVHLVELFTLFIAKGFTISVKEDIDEPFTPLDQNIVNLLFACDLEKRTFEDIKASITGKLDNSYNYKWLHKACWYTEVEDDQNVFGDVIIEDVD